MTPQHVIDQLAGQDAEIVLLTACDHGGQSTGRGVAEATGLNVDYVQELTAQLIRDGLVVADQSSANEVALTGKGTSIASTIRQSLISGPRRAGLIRHSVLQLLERGEQPWSQELAEQWMGEPVDPAPTMAEIDRAFSYLVEKQMIKTLGTWQGPTQARSILSEGIDALHRNQLLYPRANMASVLNDHRDMRDQSVTVAGNQGTIGVISAGEHNTVTATVRIAPEALEQVRQALGQALTRVEELPASERELVREALEDAAEVASTPAPRRSLLHRCMNNALVALTTSAGTSAGQSIMGVLHNAAAVI